MSKATTVALLLLAVAVPLTLCQENLPVGFSFPENFIVKNTMTVSGISAGGAMAVQFHFAHSSIVHGAAVVAGLPFYCSRGSIIGAGECMFVGKLIDTKQLMDTALKYESEGLIDPLRNIANQPVFLWSGRDDIIVQPPAMHAVQKMYQSLNVTSSLVSYFNFSAEHAWPVSVGGNSCGHLGPPFINNCGFDFSGAFLRAAFASFQLEWNATYASNSLSHLYWFDQTQFGANPEKNSMSDKGLIYIPPQCFHHSVTHCHLHVNFHGCLSDEFFLKNEFAMGTQLTNWAESNNLVLLMPQVAPDLLADPAACWDWMAYTNGNFATREGVQMHMVRKMIEFYAGI